MKRFCSLLLSALFPLLTTACLGLLDEEEKPQEDPQLSLSASPSSLSFPAEGGTLSFRVNTAYPSWWAEKDGDWYRAFFDETSVEIVVPENTTRQERKGVIYLRGSKDGTKVHRSVEVPFSQAAGGGEAPSKVSATIGKDGGDVKAGYLRVTIPSGTFAANTEIKVEKLPENSIREGQEASDFYKVTLPVSTSGPITLSLEGENLGEGVDFIAHAPSAGMHDLKEGYSDANLDASYANGCYTVTIPAIENDGETGSLDISFGLVKRIGTRAETRASTGTIKPDVNWDRQLYYTLELNEMVNKYAREAVDKIISLGFDIVKDPNRIIYIHLCRNKDEEEWGGFRQSYVFDRWSVLELNDRKLFFATEEEVAKTIYHEIFHYFQADYDPRCPANKARNVYCDWLMLQEAGGTWIETLVGSPTSAVLYDNIAPVFRSLDPLDELYPGVYKSGIFIDTMKKDVKFQPHGYGLGALLSFIYQKHGAAAMVTLYQQMKKKKDTTRACLEGMAAEIQSKLFSWDYQDFLTDLGQGRVISNIHFLSLTPEEEIQEAQYGFTNAGTSHTFSRKIYPYGGAVDRVDISKEQFSGETFDGYALMAEEKTSGVYHFVYLQSKGSYTELCNFGSSDGLTTVCNDAKTLQDIQKSSAHLFILTINTGNYSTIRSELTVSLDKEKPTLEVPEKIETAGYAIRSDFAALSATTNQPKITCESDSGWLKVIRCEQGWSDTWSIYLQGEENNGEAARTAQLTIKAGTDARPDRIIKTVTVRQYLKYEGLFLGWWASDNNLTKTLTLDSDGKIYKNWGGGENTGYYWVSAYHESGSSFSGAILEPDGTEVSFTGRKTNNYGSREMTYQGVFLANYYDNGM